MSFFKSLVKVEPDESSRRELDDEPFDDVAIEPSRRTEPNATVRHVILTPTRPPPVVPAEDALVHHKREFSLDTLDQPPQSVMLGHTERASSTQEPAAFTNFIVANCAAGGPPATTADTGFTRPFIDHMMRAPPHRSMPASASPAAKVRLDAAIVPWEHFVHELCVTARAGEPACCRGTSCKALDIENAYGQKINATPFVAHWFPAERALFDSAERETFMRQLALRMCIVCEMSYAARVFYNSTVTNSAINASHNVKAAIGWFVLVNRDGEFQQCETIGPDASCFNGLIGSVPRSTVVGWSIQPTYQTARVEFLPPYHQYPDAGSSDARKGF